MFTSRCSVDAKAVPSPWLGHTPQAMLPCQLGSPARAPAPEVAAPHLGLVLNLQTFLNFPIRSDVSQLSAEQLGSRCGEHKVLRERVLRD